MTKMNITDKNIDSLRKFFTVSVAAFDLQHTISKAFGYKCNISYMHHLHLIAKKEIEKETPDLKKIDILLSMMENCAIENSKEKQDNSTK